MTELRAETQQFLRELESFSGRTLRYGEEIGILLDVARSGGKMQIFEDVVFYAKFLSKSFDLMARIGPRGDGYDKVASEFEAGIEKASTLVRTLVKESPDELKDRFVKTFLRLDQESLSGFVLLMKELAWVKNWMVDGKPLP